MHMYTLERWDNSNKVWKPCGFTLEDLNEVQHMIELFEEAMPHGEFRPAQYTVSEIQHITIL